jgi:uncharacterized membrane protein HdeD (DUF308 family)
MDITFARSWKALALRGITALFFGVVISLWSRITLTELVLVFGGYALADGLLAIASATHFGVREHRWLQLLEGFVGIGIGLAVFFWNGLSAMVLVDCIAAWAAATGVLELAMASRLRRELPGELLLGFAGVASLLLGLLMLLWPMTGAFVIVVLLACYALFFGMAILVLAIRLRRLSSHPSLRRHAGGTPAGVTS